MISLNNRTSVDLHKCCQLHWEGLKVRLRTKRLHKLDNYGLQGTVRKFLDDNLEAIICEKPSELLKLHYQFERIIAAAGAPPDEQRTIRGKMSEIFDYKWLTTARKEHTYWIFTLADNLSVDVCPYCNANFTMTIKDSVGGKVARPAFDHFFDKGRYPILSISFYNLIPSCGVCNSDLKGANPFNLAGHFHPFIHDIEGEILFTTTIRSYGATYGFNDDFDLDIVSRPGSPQEEKVRNHITAFRLKEIYQYRKSFAAEIIKKNYVLSGTYTESLMNAFPSLTFSKADLYRFAYGNFLEDEDLGLRPMAKMTRDLVQNFENHF